MALHLSCPCGKPLFVKDELAGRKVRCPVCQRILDVAAPSPARASAPPAQPARRFPGSYDGNGQWVEGGLEESLGPAGMLIVVSGFLEGAALGAVLGWVSASHGAAVVGGGLGCGVGLIGGLVLGYITGRIRSRKARRILEAAFRGDAAEVAKALEQGCPADASRWLSGVRPLHLARTAEAARLLLDRGAAVDPPTRDCHYTPLHYALLDDRVEVIRILLDRGAAATGLHHARSRAAAQLLLARGANVEAGGVEAGGEGGWCHFPGALGLMGWPLPPLLLATRNVKGTYLPYTGAEDGIKSFVAEINGKRMYRIGGGWTPLHSAAKGDRPEVVAALLAAGANVNAADSVGLTPLHRARSAAVVQMLLARGADVRARAWSDVTPLHVAVLACRREVIPALLAAGADVHARMHMISNEHVVAHTILTGNWLLDSYEVMVRLLHRADDGSWLVGGESVNAPRARAMQVHALESVRTGSSHLLKRLGTDSFELSVLELAQPDLSKLTAVALLREGLDLNKELKQRGNLEQAERDICHLLARHGGGRPG